MKYLIAGYGSIGRRHFRNLRALGKEDILFYRSGKGQFDNRELEGHIVERDIEAALAHKPGAVIVSNPTALHLDVALPAAEAGCALLLEKPISHSMQGIPELEAAVKRSGSRVLVGFQFRYHPGLLKMHQIISSGELGEVLFGRAHWGEYLPAWHPYEDYRRGYSARSDLGGGVVLTLCHPFDYLRWILGEVDGVFASTRRSGSLEIDVEDEAEVVLQHRSGAKMTVHLDYLQKAASHSLDLVLSEGMLRWDAKHAALNIYRSKEGQWERANLAADYERNDLFFDLMRHFVEVAELGESPSCNLEDGVAALQIALAAHKSADEGQEVRLDG